MRRILEYTLYVAMYAIGVMEVYTASKELTAMAIEDITEAKYRKQNKQEVKES